jgi:LacI family transcriptional regulator
MLRRYPVPCVIVDHRPPRIPVDHVITDDRAGAISAVTHLIQLGRRRIAHISTGFRSSPAMDRLEGYKCALEVAGIPLEPELIVGDSFEPASGAIAMDRLLKLPNPPTAVFAASDYAAAGAIQVLRNRALRIPADVAVVGFSDMDFAQFLNLSSVSRSPLEIGRQAARRILKRIENPHLAPEGIVIPTQLVVRGSSAGI